MQVPPLVQPLGAEQQSAEPLEAALPVAQVPPPWAEPLHRRPDRRVDPERAVVSWEQQPVDPERVGRLPVRREQGARPVRAVPERREQVEQ